MEFTDALRLGDVAALRGCPKADRHCHSLLGASLRSVREWAGATIEAPPVRMADLDAMRDWARTHLYPHIRTRRGIEFTAERAAAESVEDGVRILEMSVDVNFANLYDDGIAGFLAFIHRLAAGYRGRLELRPELGLSKNRPASSQIEPAIACIDSGLFASIDLYGNEHAQPPEAYVPIYDHARERGLRLKAHVGEFGDARLIERTMRVLGLHEIQHGVTAAMSTPLMQTLARERVRLNVCPGSNVALSVARDLASHPIATLFRHGVRVSINSDDKTVFGRTVSDEYLALYHAGTLRAEELDAIRRDSLEG